MKSRDPIAVSMEEVMSAKSQYQVIIPPNKLQAKISKTGGPSMAKMTANAEEAIRKIKENYAPVVQADLRKISDAISRATDEPTSMPDALKEIFGISHDIKGQAATLDYPFLRETGVVIRTLNRVARTSTKTILFSPSA